MSTESIIIALIVGGIGGWLAGQIGAREIRFFLDSTAKDHQAEHGAVGKIGAREVGAHEPGTVQIRPRELRARKIG